MKKTHNTDRLPVKRKSGVKIVLIALLCIIVLCVSVILVFIMTAGYGTRSSAEGTVLSSTPNATEQAPADPDPSESVPAASTSADPAPDPNLAAARALLEHMTLEEKLCQMLFVTPEGLTGASYVNIAGPLTQAALETYPVGGIVYSSSNIESATQITDMIRDSKQLSDIPLFFGVEEEGGRASPLNAVYLTEELEPMAYYGAQGDLQAVRDIGVRLGQQLLSAGFNLDFAPVADILTNPDHTEIGDRSFSSDPQIASQMVAAMVSGLNESGVVSCLKYFPGYGAGEGLSSTQRTLEDLRSAELLPFRAGIEAGVGMVMVSHMSAPEIIGDNTPCDLSSVIVTDLLRGELGYDGVIITHAHDMTAITDNYSSGDAAVLAVLAGCDIILMPNDLHDAFTALLAAAQDGTLSQERIDESVLRILQLKYRFEIIE